MSSTKRPIQRDSKGSTSGTTSRSRKKGKINKFRLTVFILIVILLLTVMTAGLVLLVSALFGDKSTSSKKVSVFGLKEVSVSGNIHNTTDEVVKSSGLVIGQNIFTINKNTVAKNVLEQLPYVNKVTVESPAFDKLAIRIYEATPVGVIDHDGGWLVIGDNGKGLEQLNDGGDYIRILGKPLSTADIGKTVLDERSQTIVQTIIQAMESYKLNDILEIDVSDPTDIRMNWNDRITIMLGNDSNLNQEIRVVSTNLHRVLEARGEDARGRIDVSFYSDNNPDNDQMVFTPADILATSTTPTSTTGIQGTTTASAQ